MSRRHLFVVTGEGPQRQWDYVDEVKQEIQRLISFDPPLKFDLDAKLRLAEQGKLRFRQQVLYPLDLRPDLAEIRLILGRDRHFRLYFAEPVECPHLLLALCFHRKRVGNDVDSQQVRDDQDHYIEEAGRRYDAWRERFIQN